ncbi:hypothetical protein [Demequina sp. NBRC 110057]|uniref:hypothetical protein n=1 Tax=Demequina sp. NBRC 110057 TaxID=1570346 RepID=UPI00117745C6|nr:hypothetical protein [Demequina sp. NBRC 110057]
MTAPAPHGSGSGMPLSIRIIGRSSAPGAIFVLAVAAIFVVGLPLLARTVTADEVPAAAETSAVTLGTPADGTLTITPAGEWVQGTATDAYIEFTNAGAVLSIAAPQPVAATGTPEQVIAATVDNLTSDVAASWVASDPVEISTDAGDPGLCVTGTTVADVAMTCAVQHGEEVSTLTATASAQVWPSLQPSVDTILRSMTFTGPAA